MVNDYKVEVGLYPETVGVPVSVISSEGTVIATALKLDGWPKLLPDNSKLNLTINGEANQNIIPGKPFNINLNGKSVITITGAEIQLPKEAGNEKVPFKAIFTLEPHVKLKQIPVTLTLNREAVKYNHQFIDLSNN